MRSAFRFMVGREFGEGRLLVFGNDGRVINVPGAISAADFFGGNSQQLGELMI